MIRIVQLGAKRTKGEGVRLGTVRRPPRGVPKTEFASRNFYDVWLPTLAPSDALVKEALRIGADDAKSWKTFERRYRSEMKEADVSRLLDTLAALSKQTNFAVGCYCENEQRCHRSILREILIEHGADVAR
jgi:uncharacterized protein YeaO (DUF488 family)